MNSLTIIKLQLVPVSDDNSSLFFDNLTKKYIRVSPSIDNDLFIKKLNKLRKEANKNSGMYDPGFLKE